MSVLFRVPLFDFDPTNEHEIEDHWENVLEAISVSSKSLYSEISGKPYRNLNPYVKKKVFKYILRGRYRATPFGRFAAVGIGDFEDSPKYQLDLERIISLKYLDEEQVNIAQTDGSSFLINDKYERWGNFHFLTYLQEGHHWGIVEVPKNEIVEFLIQKLKDGKEVTFEKFIGWFENPCVETVRDIWEKLLGLGIINSELNMVSQIRSNQKNKVDQVFEDSISLPRHLQKDIKDFEATAGKLFSPTTSSYVELLRDWFEDKFDDRFVPLSLLSVNHEFLTGSFLKKSIIENEGRINIELPEKFWKSEHVNLEYYFKPEPINSEIFDLQYVFKLLGNSTIHLENIVCNRPFVYFGRFNREETLYRDQTVIKDQIFQDRQVIYAELRLFETELVDSICMTRAIFAHYITPIPDSSPNAIQLKDIELGLIDGRFFLVHRTLKKTIVPVITHPLNGREISHPVMRLLWELEHQRQFKFFPFSLSRRLDTSYIPRLSWGNIILQNRKWVLRSAFFSTELDLKKWLEKSEVPSPLAAGYLDRELILDWNKEMELNILWSELNKWGKINIMDPSWLGKSEFFSKNGKPIYPQFVIRGSKAKFEPVIHRFINSIEHCDEDCLYFLIRVNEENLIDYLTFWFDNSLLSYLEEEKILWYFLVYPSKNLYQVRIRFLNLTENQQTLLLNFIIPKSRDGVHSIEIRPYYPEIKKYGRTEYRKSEMLFYLESTHLMYQKDCQGQQLIGSHSCAKAALLMKLWGSLVSNHPLMAGVYTYSRSKVKALGNSELKNVRRIWQESSSSGPLEKHEVNWINNYSGIFLDHLNLQLSEEAGLRLIINHIHMQVNRFFLNERKEHEDLIHFHLYKCLGRMIYGL
ncbi:thiopeptide-type bacteriocin biosynthesis protein [Algoriphagus aquaeductus]|uniref:Thiopeptide-type bacteriocin biosynthesis protein n=1 Tax=Algoriphagus aquaeductus TaxID=475299 RepID=A0A326RMB5_9BACT|nr:lantibiotic dehydratase [Algoriphagus aquaeductus]PZV76017.1 thiopeptide-type bacteriocin biosynthesis protein [Algoriphagus aquaeductus]